MKTVGIIYNDHISGARALADAIYNQLSLGKESWVAAAEELHTFPQRVAQANVVVTVGGDGTILRAMQVTAPLGVPLVGINMGRLGFMTELQVNEALEKLPSYFDGQYRVEERNMLQARVCQGKNLKDGPFHALNEAVLARDAVSRLVTVRAIIDDVDMTTYRADGVILSTATGSTGYNLAIGGPVLDPESSALVLKPVAPQSGLTAGLILNSSSKICLSLEGPRSATLSLDGQVDSPLEPGDRVELEQSPFKAKFLRFSPALNFYATLTQRLGFGVRNK
jgi:NAD+ kinase